MAPLGVDPVALDSAGAEVVTAGEGLDSVISRLTATLSGCAGMAGDDPAGAALGHRYDSSAAKLVTAMVATRNGLCSLGDGVRMSAHNYSLADAMSSISGPGSPLPTPSVTGPMSAGSAPSSVGTGDGAPPGWGWVAPYIGMIWPTADTAKLRAAGTAWGAAGTKFALTEILGTGGPMGAIRAQHIPEGSAIDRAFTDAYGSTTRLVQQCQKIADQLNSYAAEVDKVHAAILDLLSRICDPLTGIKEVWETLTGEDEDEIKRIAEDIRTVVDSFTAEVDALQAQIAATLAEAVTIATTMGSYAATQWDQFLHGTEVGRGIDEVGQYANGMWSEAGGFLKGLWDISQGRLLVDPVGYGKDLGQIVLGAAPLVGLGGQHAPSIEESWKQLGKSLVHWDEWETNPASALGKSVFDVATLALPGGPLSKVGKAGRTAADALRGLRKPPLPELPKPPSIEPPTKAPAEPPRPGPRPPAPGGPTPAPPAKPAPGPANGPLPHSPTESKPPVVEKPPGGEPPLGPRPAEPVPARAPALPGESPPGGVHSPTPAPAPHPLPGESMPTSGHPAELSPDSSIEYVDAEPRLTISGHGAYHPDDGYMAVPRGTTITVYAEHGSSITDELGNLIETGGDTSGVYSRTFHPGEQIPDYTIYPPDGLNVMGTPKTVLSPTLLSELVNEEMGGVHLAICPFDEACPTGIIYDVDGTYDQSTGVFIPYRRRKF